jgi:EmrB/QacA subfamily drug resistance transporter
MSAPARAAGRSRAPRKSLSPGKVFAIVAVAVFLALLDLFIVNIAFPAIQAGFDGASLSDVSWVLSAYAIVYAALLVPAGKLGDIIGRRRVFVAGLLAFGVGSALCAVAPTLPFLIGARILQAAGAAAVTPTSLGLLLPVLPPKKRPVAIGGWAAIGAVGAAVGPPLGGMLTEISWNWIFLINVPIALVTAVLAWRRLEEVRDPARPQLPDLVGTVLLVASVTLVNLGLVKGPDWGWDARSWGSMAGALLLTVAFVVRSRRHSAPVLELSILRVPAFALACIAATLFFAAFAAMLLSNVLYLTEVWHYSAIKAGMALTAGPLAVAAVAPVSGRLIRRFGPGLIGGLGGVVYGFSVLLWIWSLDLHPAYASGYLPGMLIGGVGIGLALPAFTVAATATLPPQRLATGIGAQTMFRQIGATFGVAGFVAILGTPARSQIVHAFNQTRVFMVLCVALAAVALLLIRRRDLRLPPPAPAGTTAGVPAADEQLAQTAHGMI